MGTPKPHLPKCGHKLNYEKQVSSKGLKVLKKVLSFLFSLIAVALLTGGYFVFERYRKNPEQIVPYPYRFENPAPALELEAPILIVGDQMGHYLARFQAELATTISVNLDKPIKIQSIAQKGHGLHRTLHELKAISPWPQILIYQGGSEEFSESKFNVSEINLIRKNFGLYQDDRIETTLILFPWLSRLVYWPINQVILPIKPALMEEIRENEYINKLETELLLFEQQLIQLVNLSKDRNTLLILTTTPINLDVAPKKICEFTTNIEIEKEISELKELMGANNHKAAYGKSSRMIKQHLGNPHLLFMHGQVAKRMGLFDEAKNSLLEATAYDCSPWRASAVHNSIIRRVAREHQIIMFDFAKLLEEEWNANNTTFFDELFPQNLYYDRGMKQLGLLIKKILKL
jgi:hypothetical protein